MLKLNWVLDEALNFFALQTHCNIHFFVTSCDKHKCLVMYL